jgi:hypothetical protein
MKSEGPLRCSYQPVTGSEPDQSRFSQRWLWRMLSSRMWGCVDNRRFGGKQCLHLPPPDAGSPLADFSTMRIEAIRSSETSVNVISTQRHIPEDDILQTNPVHNSTIHFLKNHLNFILVPMSTCPKSSPQIFGLKLYTRFVCSQCVLHVPTIPFALTPLPQ